MSHTHDQFRERQNIPEWGKGSWLMTVIWSIKGGIFDRITYDYDQHIRDDFTEFPEIELDLARTKVWTVELEDANRRWYECKRKKGSNLFGACLEEGEAVRVAHWKHQLEVQDTGCDRPMHRYAKCLQRAERYYPFCRDLEHEFVNCVVDSKKLNLVPEVPPALQRRKKYTGFLPWDIVMYKRWIKNRNEFLEEHPDWFKEDDVEIMDAKHLYKFVSRKQHWLDQDDVKPFSTFAWPQRYREYVWKKDLVVE